MSQQQQVIPFMEPLHIIGGGSIGMLFAASIRASFPSFPLSLLLRDHHKPNIDDNEIMICLMKHGKPRMIPVPAQLISDERPRPIRNLIVATKAYNASDAVRSISARLDDKGASIIILCNGAFAVRDELQAIIPPTTTLRLATTTHGVYRESSYEGEMYHIVHAGEGSTFIEDEPAMSQLWDQSGLVSTSMSPDEMTGLLWQKLAVNCSINPLTALRNCENGQLLSENLAKDTLPTIDDIVREVSMVAMKVCPSQDLQSSLSYGALRFFVDQVCEDTFHNRSSMLQDVTKRQPTEIQYLNGYVSKLGKDLGIDTPANDELYRRIKDFEAEHTD